jgi:hypothetical protein
MPFFLFMETPPLPLLDSPVLLEIFTHDSLRQDSLPVHPSYRDRYRLSFLGEHTLKHAVAYCYFQLKPLLSVREIQVGIYYYYSVSITNQFTEFGSP